MSQTPQEIAESEAFKTAQVSAVQSFKDLFFVIDTNHPFTSYSRPEPVVWSKDRLINRIFQYLDGGEANLITRANGLRDKVVQLKSQIK